MQRKLILLIVGLTGLLLGFVPEASALEKWGPFRGQIVDGETGVPIAGAAVLVIWRENVPNPVQGASKFYDAREAVTDGEGRFEVPRLSPPFFSFRIERPNITYFAPGYAPDREVVTPPEGEPFVAPTVVQMQRLKTKDELWRKRRSRPYIPEEKMVGFIRAINVERKMLGLEPIPIEPMPRSQR